MVSTQQQLLLAQNYSFELPMSSKRCSTFLVYVQTGFTSLAGRVHERSRDTHMSMNRSMHIHKKIQADPQHHTSLSCETWQYVYCAIRFSITRPCKPVLMLLQPIGLQTTVYIPEGREGRGPTFMYIVQ